MRFKGIILIYILMLWFCSVAFCALDLKFIGGITITPSAPCTGNNVEFKALFRTMGAAVDNLRVTGGIGTTIILDQSFAHIDQGINTDISFSWIATAGTKNVWFNLDPEKKTSDVNFNNNVLSQSITISNCSVPSGKPNLTADAVYTPLIVNNLTDITFTITISNKGNAASPASKAGFYSFGGLDMEFDIPPLNPNAKHTFSYIWKANCAAPCNAYIMVIADSTKMIDESDENDNVWSKNYICDCAGNYKPNLKVSAVYSPLNFKKGDIVKFDITVVNDGDRFSAMTYLGFYEFDTLKIAFDIPPLDKGKNYALSYNWSAVCNAYCIAIIDLSVDYTNYEPDESNEMDNHWKKIFKCSGCTQLTLVKPDNIITNIDLQLKNLPIVLPNLKITDSSYTCGIINGKLTGNLKVTVMNSGNCIAEASKLAVFEDPLLLKVLAVKDVPALGPGEIKTVNFYLEAANLPQMVNVVIDYNKVINESDETDNAMKVDSVCPD